MSELKKDIAYDEYMPFETFTRLVDECALPAFAEG